MRSRSLLAIVAGITWFVILLTLYWSSRTSDLPLILEHKQTLMLEAAKEIRQLRWALSRLDQSLSSTTPVVNPNGVSPTVLEPSAEDVVSQLKLTHNVSVLSTELFYLVRSQLTKLDKTSAQTKNREDFMQVFELLHHLLLANLASLGGVNPAVVSVQQRMFTDLSAKVQTRLTRLQSPSDCAKARRLICDINKPCGFGCQMHHLLYCAIVAYGSNRTLVSKSKAWTYSNKGWSSVYQPISTCDGFVGPTVYWDSAGSDDLSVELPVVDSLQKRPSTLPPAVPKEFIKDALAFSSYPFFWWIGQFAAHYFRFQPSMQAHINTTKSRLGFRNPIVGIHVRRTDKVGLEADYHHVSEYMYWVEQYFRRQDVLKGAPVERRVYIASDEVSVHEDARKGYPGYTFVGDPDISKAAGVSSRYTDVSLYGIITDVELLSRCDYLVCTFSSQVCRLAFEIMSSRVPDTSQLFHSLDDFYYFGGQQGNPMQVILQHIPQNAEEIELQVGDQVDVAGNHWDGYSKGTNRRTLLTGLFPSYKVLLKPLVVDFPGEV